jgi:hypothetical protein
MRYQITIQTTVTGGKQWLQAYLRQLEHQYGYHFVEKLDDKGIAELESRDPDGAHAVSRYELRAFND